MNIAFTINDNYAIHCAALIESIITNKAEGTAIDFHVISNDLKHTNKSILIECVRKKIDCRISFYNCDLVDIENSFILNEAQYLSHISSDTFVRLYLTEILPVEIDKILYLDVDIIVNGDLNELYSQTQIDGYFAAVVPQIDEFFVFNNDRVYDSQFLYFNAGVILLNLKELRDINCVGLYKCFFIENSNLVLFNDQDILNYCIGNNVKYLDLKYNVITPYLRESSFDFMRDNYLFGGVKEGVYSPLKSHQEAINNPVIIHFVSRPKPWELGCSHPYRKLYFEALNSTVFSSKNQAIFKITTNAIAQLKKTYNCFFDSKNRFINHKIL